MPRNFVGEGSKVLTLSASSLRKPCFRGGATKERYWSALGKLRQ